MKKKVNIQKSSKNEHYWTFNARDLLCEQKTSKIRNYKYAYDFQTLANKTDFYLYRICDKSLGSNRFTYA